MFVVTNATCVPSRSEEIIFLVIPKSLTNGELFDGIRNEHDTRGVHWAFEVET